MNLKTGIGISVSTILMLSMIAIISPTYATGSFEVGEVVEFDLEVSSESLGDIYLKDGEYNLTITKPDGTVESHILKGKTLTIEDDKDAKIHVKITKVPGPKSKEESTIEQKQFDIQRLPFVANFYGQFVEGESFMTFTFDESLGGGSVTVPVSGTIQGGLGAGLKPYLNLTIFGPSFPILGGEAESGPFTITINPEVPIKGSVNIWTGEYIVKGGILFDAPNMRIDDGTISGAPIPFREVAYGDFIIVIG